jgi:hypothetical protein
MDAGFNTRVNCRGNNQGLVKVYFMGLTRPIRVFAWFTQLASSELKFIQVPKKSLIYYGQKKIH